MANKHAKDAKCEGCGSDAPWTLVNGEDRQHYCFTCLKLEVGELLDCNDEVHIIVNHDALEVVLL